MLRITRLSQKGRGLTIKFEGEIVGAWVGAARAAARPGAGGPGAWTWPPLPTWTRRVFNCSAT